MISIKKEVYRRSKLPNFSKGTPTTAPGPKVEIRCSPLSEKEPISDETIIESMLGDAQMQNNRKCRICDEEGHFSNRCPKSKEMAVQPVRVEESRETTIRITGLADYTTQATLGATIQKIGEEIALEFDVLHPHWKVSLPLDMDGNSRGIAFINIATAQHQIDNANKIDSINKFAEELIKRLDRLYLDNVVLNAELAGPRDRQRKPTRYDDEARWGHLVEGKHK